MKGKKHLFVSGIENVGDVSDYAGVVTPLQAAKIILKYKPEGADIIDTIDNGENKGQLITIATFLEAESEDAIWESEAPILKMVYQIQDYDDEQLAFVSVVNAIMASSFLIDWITKKYEEENYELCV